MRTGKKKIQLKYWGKTMIKSIKVIKKISHPELGNKNENK